MDVRGIGQSQAGFSAVPGPPLEGQVRQKAEEIRRAPIELLGDERLATELESLGLSPEPIRLLAARALITEQGRLDAGALAELERALASLDDPGMPEASSAAFLLTRGLPATPSAIALALKRHDASEPLGTRWIALLERLAVQDPKSPAATLLSSLALPEGGKEDLAAGLRRLIEALEPPEAELARMGEGPPNPEAIRLSEALERHPDAQLLRDDLRFSQLRSAGDPPVLSLPVWWQGGSGEIRIQGQPQGEQQGSGGTRVVIALDTPNLQSVRVDLLLAQSQLNCHVAVQDQGVAEFLAPHLSELRAALESAGVRVNTLAVRTGDPTLDQGPKAPKAVDVYG